MKTSQLFAPTLREAPAEAELPSHKYMLRAGMMRKSAAGIYSYLPLGQRVLHKIMKIVREEMDRAGGQEIMLPIVQPAELWHETGRWANYGDEMFKLKDRHSRQFCLGPTHEEIITALVRVDIRSYKELPIRLYQIQNKYRDEIRPRFGVIRGREFIMKDLYSFDKDEPGLHKSYQAMYDAYTRIFKRCGLETMPVEADSGAIGGDNSHEFMVLGESGEADIVYCPQCKYAANVERAECKQYEHKNKDLQQLTEIDTPNITTIEQLTQTMEIDASRLIKTMIYQCDQKPIAVLIRGDHVVNEVKLHKFLGCSQLELANPEVIRNVTHAPVGFAGPVGLQIPIIVDYAAAAVVNGISGANKVDKHLTNININRDYTPTKMGDIRQAQAGDECARCGERLTSARGIEVGQVFELGTKYSEPLKASFLDENGKENPLVMGCYGIGVSRTMAAIIEQHHDSDGICWPVSVAPYHVVIVPIKYTDIEQKKVADKLYTELKDVGIDVILDDRNERAGVKFKDADLIGYPIRITIGPKHLKDKRVELFIRCNKQRFVVPLDEVSHRVSEFLNC